MIELRYNTAVTVKIGPFVDNTDGYTAESGLTISQSDVRLTKNGGDMAQKSNVTACSYDENGFYNCSLSTTDTNTLGALQLSVYKTGAIRVFHDYMIVSQNYYDTKCGSDSFTVDLNSNQSDATVGTVTTLSNKTGFSLAVDQSAVTIGTVTSLTNKTGFSLSSSGITAIWNEVLTSHTTANTFGLTIWNLLRLLKNKRSVISDTETCYADNGTDALYQWTLNSDTPPFTSKTPV